MAGTAARRTDLPQRVLHIDDDADARDIVRIAFKQRREIDLQSGEGGPTALVLAAAFEPNLILLDVMMPQIDGIEMYSRLRRIPSLRSAPVIFLTALAQADDVEQYLRMGAIGSICKPFDFATLTETVIDIWQRAEPQTRPRASDDENSRSSVNFI